MSGKGSSPRPYSVDRRTFDDNWNRIFGQKKTEGDKQSEAWLKNEYYDLEDKQWDAYSGLPNPDAYKKEDDADKNETQR